MDAITLVRTQYKQANDLLETTMKDVTPELAHWAPPGIANPLGATYIHVVGGQDFLLQTLGGGGNPLAMGAFKGKTGANEMPPPPGPGMDEWARRVKVDLAQAREYAQAVYKNTDAYFAAMSPEDLDKEIDMSGFGMGKQPLSTLAANIVLQHINNHLGEISCLKGLQGAKGYPF